MESAVMGAPAIQNKVLTHLPIGTDDEEGAAVADATFDSEVGIVPARGKVDDARPASIFPETSNSAKRPAPA
jgi:hypothetical protein